MKYAELKKKYDLPDCSKVETAFDFSMPESKYLSREILKKISERLTGLCEKIENVLHSDSNLETMYECNFLSETEKEDLFAIFQEFMSKRRAITSLSFNNSEKKNCTIIKECLKTYDQHKTKLEEIFEKLSKKWTDKNNTRTEGAKYFG